jgi:N-formylglutamate amidohydrolase
MAPSPLPFDRHGPAVPESPVILSVPHAGRDYPAALTTLLRVPPAKLMALEDRHVDAIAIAARTRETLFVQRRARAWIDLNRGESERDPRVEAGATTSLAQPSLKIRSGLGLIPRRVANTDIWARRLSNDEIAARIREDHRPYHRAVADALFAARARFGIAILLDVHSMPPLGEREPRIVLGDRFGRTAASRFVHRLEAEAQAFAIPHALNTPYSGGHILERHGAPSSGMHAIQVEIDRSLYLDARLDAPGPGLARIAAMLHAMIAALDDEAGAGIALAAE